jgi:hypothetical protein
VNEPLALFLDQKTSESSEKSVDPNSNAKQHLSGRIDNQSYMEIFFRQNGIQRWGRLSKEG